MKANSKHKHYNQDNGNDENNENEENNEYDHYKNLKNDQSKILNSLKIIIEDHDYDDLIPIRVIPKEDYIFEYRAFLSLDKERSNYKFLDKFKNNHEFRSFLVQRMNHAKIKLKDKETVEVDFSHEIEHDGFKFYIYYFITLLKKEVSLEEGFRTMFIKTQEIFYKFDDLVKDNEDSKEKFKSLKKEIELNNKNVDVICNKMISLYKVLEDLKQKENSFGSKESDVNLNNKLAIYNKAIEDIKNKNEKLESENKAYHKQVDSLKKDLDYSNKLINKNNREIIDLQSINKSILNELELMKNNFIKNFEEVEFVRKQLVLILKEIKSNDDIKTKTNSYSNANVNNSREIIEKENDKEDENEKRDKFQNEYDKDLKDIKTKYNDAAIVNTKKQGNDFESSFNANIKNSSFETLNPHMNENDNLNESLKCKISDYEKIMMKNKISINLTEINFIDEAFKKINFSYSTLELIYLWSKDGSKYQNILNKQRILIIVTDVEGERSASFIEGEIIDKSEVKTKDNIIIMSLSNREMQIKSSKEDGKIRHYIPNKLGRYDYIHIEFGDANRRNYLQISYYMNIPEFFFQMNSIKKYVYFKEIEIYKCNCN